MAISEAEEKAFNEALDAYMEEKDRERDSGKLCSGLRAIQAEIERAAGWRHRARRIIRGWPGIAAKQDAKDLLDEMAEGGRR